MRSTSISSKKMRNIFKRKIKAWYRRYKTTRLSTKNCRKTFNYANRRYVFFRSPTSSWTMSWCKLSRVWPNQRNKPNWSKNACKLKRQDGSCRRNYGKTKRLYTQIYLWNLIELSIAWWPRWRNSKKWQAPITTDTCVHKSIIKMNAQSLIFDWYYTSLVP